MQKTAVPKFIRVPYFMAVKEGTEFENNPKISKFQMLRSDSEIFNNDELILYAVE